MAVSVAHPGAQDFIPPTDNLGALADAARGCRGCELYRDADQTVFGDGPPSARLLLVGEQPGDQEDRAGEPFVGPAGRLLNKALVEAGVDREQVYVTNAVKHFKFTRAAGSKRRIHKTPSRTEVVACRPWLFAEFGVIDPEVVVALGATAAKALLGNDFRLTAHRGEVLHPPADDQDFAIVATPHPSSVLRGPVDRREAGFADLVADLRIARELIGQRR